MNRNGVLWQAVRGAHHLAAWIFDRSGPLQPPLARLGGPLHRLLPGSLLDDPDRAVEVSGLRLFHTGEPTLHLQMLAAGYHDRDVAGALRQVVRPGARIVDVGAHIGYFSLVAARQAGPQGHVWAFEPAPGLLPILRRNVDANDRRAPVDVVPAAVGRAVGEAQLYAGTDPMLNSVHRSGAPGCRPPTTVPCTTLDVWAEQAGWPRVDVVKIDVEGNEVAVLDGMRALCRRNPDLVAVVELNPQALALAGETTTSFWAALGRCGLDRTMVAGPSGRPVSFPRDVPFVHREIRRQGCERVNLVCSRSPC